MAATAKHTVKIGHSISADQLKGGDSLENVVYNYKLPKSSSTRHKWISKDPSESNAFNLTVQEDGDDETANSETKFSGSRSSLTSTYALVPNPDRQGYTIHALESEFHFNVISTPDEHDSAKLGHKYPPLASDKHVYGASLASEHDVDDNAGATDSEPDPDNPYDYRHYLNKPLEKDSPPSAHRGRSPAPATSPRPGTPTPSASQRSNISTAAAHSKPATSTKPAQLKAPRKTVNKTMQKLSRGGGRPKLPRPPVTRRDSGESASTNEDRDRDVERENPTRVEQRGKATSNKAKPRAAPAPASADDADTDLILEISPSSSPRAKRQTLTFLGTPSQSGPISLHSAAASPLLQSSSFKTAAGRGAGQSSAARRSRRDEDDELELEWDTTAPADHSVRRRSSAHSAPQKADTDEDDDADVDELELPRPAMDASKRASLSGAGSASKVLGGAGASTEAPGAPVGVRSRRDSMWDADTMADFQEQLEQAFEDDGEEDEQEDKAVTREDESEESEEE